MTNTNSNDYNNEQPPMNCAVIGGSGSIASAMVLQLQQRYPDANIQVFSSNADSEQTASSVHHPIDYDDENSLAHCAQLAAQNAPLDIVFVGLGMLHNVGVAPEKSLAELNANNLHALFAANTVAPALLAKHFIPQLNKSRPSVFTALSARVGSISDNRLGGWYAYRAAKSALNMVIKTTAIETARRNKNAIIVGMHPGTVDSPLSKPFQRNVPEGKLFTPAYSASQLLAVIEQLRPADSGKCFAWDGQEIQP